jgi:hypothetical protein
LLDGRLLQLSDVPCKNIAGQKTRTFYGNREEDMSEGVNTVDLHLDEKEAALLARAVEWLVQELGYPPEDVCRSYRDSFSFFLKNP